MATLLLDTNIVSFLQKGDSRATSYAVHLQGHSWAISAMTIAELYQWTAIHKWGLPRIQELERKLKQDYICLPIDWETCRLWGVIRAEGRATGYTISPQDAWIAATGRQYNLPLVTHNPADFVPISGLKIITEAK